METRAWSVCGARLILIGLLKSTYFTSRRTKHLTKTKQWSNIYIYYLELVQKGEDNIISAMPDKPAKDSYSAITSVIHTVPVIISPDSESNAHESRSSSLGDFVFQSTYFSLLKYKFFIDDCERSKVHITSPRGCTLSVRFIILPYNEP